MFVILGCLWFVSNKYCFTDFIFWRYISTIFVYYFLKPLNVAPNQNTWCSKPRTSMTTWTSKGITLFNSCFSLLVLSTSPSISVSFKFQIFLSWCDCFVFWTSANTDAGYDSMGCLMTWYLNIVGYSVKSKPKYFMLLSDLSTKTTRRINNIVGSIKTKLLSTFTPFVKLTFYLLSISCCFFCISNWEVFIHQEWLFITLNFIIGDSISQHWTFCQ